MALKNTDLNWLVDPVGGWERPGLHLLLWDVVHDVGESPQVPGLQGKHGRAEAQKVRELEVLLLTIGVLPVPNIY